jgi:adenylate kinase family enzyme
MAIGEMVFNIIVKIIGQTINNNISKLDFFKKRRIEGSINDTVAKVCEPMINYLNKEKISTDKQERLFYYLGEELKILFDNSSLLFQSSLKGQKIFEQFYENRSIPQTVTEDGLKEIYSLFFPRITTTLCDVPLLVKEWEVKAWAENFSRLDEFANNMNNLAQKVDKLVAPLADASDELINMTRKAMAQKIALDLDLTGLRSDTPYAGKFSDYFVHPSIKEYDKEKEKIEKERYLNTEEDSMYLINTNKMKSVVYGAPGAGKSTWTKWLQQTLLTPEWNGICIRIELRQLAKGPLPTSFDLIRQVAGKYLSQELSNDILINWIKQRKVAFIYDGYDELDKTRREEMLEEINTMCTSIRECPIIITSRPLTTDQLERLTGEWTHWKIEAFNKERVLKYVDKWYKSPSLLQDAIKNIEVEALVEKWMSDRTIGPLTGNPLLLSTLLMVHHLDGSLPTGRSGLYQRYISGMLGIWDDRRHVAASTITLNTNDKKRIIQSFALSFFMNRVEQVEKEIAVKWMQEVLTSYNIKYTANDVLDFFIERSGLIIGPGVYSFTHKSIMEYLVAEVVLEGNKMDIEGKRIDRAYLYTHRGDDQWNTVIYLWAGLAPNTDVETFIEWCINDNDFPLGFGILNDQLEKFTKKQCHSFMHMKYKELNKKMDLKTYHWYVPGPITITQKNKLVIPNIVLRSINNGNDLIELMGTLIRDGKICKLDMKGLSGPIRELVWMCLFKNGGWKSNIIVSLKYHRKASVREEEILWFSWSIWLIIKTQIKLNESYEKYLKKIREGFPEFSWLIPLALITIAIAYALEQKYVKKNSEGIVYNYVSKIIDELIKCDEYEYPEKWLRGTRSWNIFAPYHRSEDTDLLKRFILIIQEINTVKAFENVDSYNRSLDYVNKLIKRRDSLKKS